MVTWVKVGLLILIPGDSIMRCVVLWFYWAEKMSTTPAAKTGLLSCIAHVINLVKRCGLAVLGTINNKKGEQISMGEIEHNSKATKQATTFISISRIIYNPKRIGLNIKTILKWVHGLSKT
ncbi:hypothetical protein VP01_4289g1 [Puccinia sorghi]|uniref:Uncharacterized protein n=1 Tax=Puccinia sorghi TaxID=27349 RepID=A0A0L6UR18_9BASI|nr:hypothetical protein VP01_4289g1 [Puccinia sorghi]